LFNYLLNQEGHESAAANTKSAGRFFSCLSSILWFNSFPMNCEKWSDSVSREYEISADIIYGNASGVPLLLDVFQCKRESEPRGQAHPAAIWYHGGGWCWGDKNQTVLRFLPLLRLGFTVFTVNYRLAEVALAPAAVEDARLAFRWVINSAEKYNIDTERIVLTGTSAGAHLALLSGMQCDPRPAAIVDFWGITDVDDVLHGPNEQQWARDWIGDTSNHELAREMSPLTLVRSGMPPVLMIHGDPDPDVPYEHSVRLKAALDKAGVPNRLVRYPGGGHGDFSPEDAHDSWNEVRTFLGEHGVCGTH
jgi:acetyl esterase/lipase